MTVQLTASSVHRALVCGYPYSDDAVTTPREAGTAAQLGTTVHATVEAMLRGTIADDGSDVYKIANRASGWVAANSGGGPTESSLIVERGFVYDSRNDKAQWGPRRGEDGYDFTPALSLRGTIDYAWVVDGVLYVVDLKTGKTQNAHPEQLYTQALAVARILGLTQCKVGFLFARKTKVIPPTWINMDADMLDSWVGVLHKRLRTLPIARAERNDGCRWCDVLPADCPATNADYTVVERMDFDDEERELYV